MSTAIQDKSIVSELEKTLISMAEQRNSAALVLSDYRNEKQLLQNGIITENEFLLFEQSIFESIGKLPKDVGPNPEPALKKYKSSVFLSYNNADLNTALKIQEKLDEYDINVHLDINTVQSGQDIKQFIMQQINENNAVILLTSKNSLMSVWVSYESTLSIFNQLLNNKNVLLLGLDDEFKNDDFFESVKAELNLKIKAMVKRIERCNEENEDPYLYANQHKQLLATKQQLPNILEKLRACHVELINDTTFEHVMKGIANQLLKIAADN